MNYDEVKRNIVRNAVSNYIRTVLNMALGLFMFRMLFQSLSREEFGFWSLLWSVFGYGVLLDFGFGFAAQKRVAECSARGEWDQLSRILSTILVFYSVVSVVIMAGVLLGADRMLEWFQVTAGNRPAFKQVLILFFLGIALAFPMGVFPEILRGQQRIRLSNNIASAATVLKFGLIAAAVHWHWGFLAIMGIALAFSLIPDFIVAGLALGHMPKVKLSPRLFSRGVVVSTLSFSVFAYINTATNIILGKTDQLVLSTVLGVAAAALYQAGAKVAEIFGTFTIQIQDTLSPAAAHLHARGDRGALRDLLLSSTHWSTVIATPLYLLCAFYMENLIRLLTGEAVVGREMWLTGEVLLLWFYSNILTHSVSKRIFMMCGHEKRLMVLGLAEGLTNLGLSIGLAMWWRNVAAVAIGSLIPATLIGWGVLWPWVAKEAGSGGLTLLGRIFLPKVAACLPMAALLAGFRFLPWHQGTIPFWVVMIESTVAVAIGGAGLWKLALKAEERAALLARFRRKPKPEPEPA